MTVYDATTDTLQDKAIVNSIAAGDVISAAAVMLFEAEKSTRNTTSPETELDGTDWIRKGILSIRRVSRLGNNWDGEGSPPPDSAAVAAATKALLHLRSERGLDVPAPFVCPIPGGGVQLEWTSPSKHLEIEFIDGGRIACLWEETSSPVPVVETDEFRADQAERIYQRLEWFGELGG